MTFELLASANVSVECIQSVFVPSHAFTSEYFMPQLYLQCLQLMCTLPPSDPNRDCPPLFDGIGCWPPTPANTTQHIPCPKLSFYDHSKTGSHRCEWSRNNTPVWGAHPDYPLLVWSDYSLCEHAVLKNRYQVVQVIYYVGHALSLLFTSVAFLVFAIFPKLHCPRNMIHMNFFGSIALFCGMYFLQILLSHKLILHSLLCNITHALVQYCFQCTYFWMLCEAAYLHKTVVTNVFGSNEQISRFVALGWGFPFLIVGAYVITNLALGKSDVCWIESYSQTLNLILEIPLLLCIAVNLLFLISVLRVLIPKLNSQHASSHTNSHQVAIKSAKAIIFLSPLFGVHTVITLWMPQEDSDAHIVLGIVQACLQSFQGFFVATVFCFGNSEVQHEMQSKFLERRQRNRQPTEASVVTAKFSLTQVSAVLRGERSEAPALQQCSQT